MKKALAFTLSLAMVMSMATGCSSKPKETEAPKAETEAKTEAGVETEASTEKTTSGDTYKAALLVPGTLGDKSFWDSSNEGLQKLKDELGEEIDKEQLMRYKEI